MMLSWLTMGKKLERLEDKTERYLDCRRERKTGTPEWAS